MQSPYSPLFPVIANLHTEELYEAFINASYCKCVQRPLQGDNVVSRHQLLIRLLSGLDSKPSTDATMTAGTGRLFLHVQDGHVQRCFYISMYAITLCEGDSVSTDYHPLTRYIFWAAVLTRESPFEEIAYRYHYMMSAALIQLEDCGWLTERTSLGQTPISMIYFLDCHLCMNCFGRYNRREEHQDASFDFHACVLGALINWQGSYVGGRGTFRGRKIKFQSGNILEIDDTEFNYSGRAAFQSWLELDHIRMTATYTCDSDSDSD